MRISFFAPVAKFKTSQITGSVAQPFELFDAVGLAEQVSDLLEEPQRLLIGHLRGCVVGASLRDIPRGP